MSQAPKTIYLSDYTEPDFYIAQTYLEFDLYLERTHVSSKLAITRNTQNAQAPLVLHGQDLDLHSVSIDGKKLTEQDYTLTDTTLTVHSVPNTFTFECVTQINPLNNTSLEGLYKSRTIYCTQCEAEGFRKITYYLDRPDVMSVFTVKVIGDKKTCPVLLSNGNEQDSGDIEGEPNRHFVTWHDPFKKPAYLFALVAGDLSVVDDTFTTQSGKNVLLRIFVEEKDTAKCGHAMQALKDAMVWDEKIYGREYDLDIYMIVAVDDFNMGAMENKGLNVFNTSCVLASPDITTDAGYQRVEAVVAHEYFHNWSGNRVTCRDWFQLSLKEGFTVFRDAEFSADMGSRTVKRVEDVSLLRSMQFAEDAGPLSHQVQPDSFIEISNFYTLTIYEKGAEIVRMIRTLIGEEMFRKGADLYFDRHDGQAVTIKEFVAAMADASGRDFIPFMHWYKQAGTPKIAAKTHYNSSEKTLTVQLKQTLPKTKLDQPAPFVIPLNISLLSEEGAQVIETQSAPVRYLNNEKTQAIIEFDQHEATYVFTGVSNTAAPVLLREFSAPVNLQLAYTKEDLANIIRHETDGFTKWDAAQQYAMLVIKEVMAALVENPVPSVDPTYLALLKTLLTDNTLDPAMVALMMTLPSESEIGDQCLVTDVDVIHHARKRVVRKIATSLYPELLACVERNQADSYSVDAQSIAKRALKNKALSYLVETGKEEAIDICCAQYDNATNMTDKLSALTALVHSTKPSLANKQATYLDKAYSEWQDESLAVNLWFSVQASSPSASVDKTIKPLMAHDAFDMRNPNKLRALIGGFTMRNPVNFHDKTGAGYAFLADQIIALDAQNPQVASRLMTPLTRWKKYDEKRQALMKKALERIKAKPQLSSDVFEVVEKSLNA